MPQIRLAIEKPGVPLLDRRAIEILFGVKARQAVHLAHRLGGYAAGKSMVVPRATVLAFLSAVERNEFHFEEERRHRVRESVEVGRRMLAARRVVWQVPVTPPTLLALPDGVVLEPGRLEVHCQDAGDLLQKLHALSRAIAADYPAFEAAARG